MRVLMLSKACIVGIYQRKLEEMAALAPEMELVVAVPPRWRDGQGSTTLEAVHTQGYRLEVLPLWLNGQFHLHVYPTLGRLLREVRPDVMHIDEEPYNLATYHAHRLARRQGAKSLWFSWQNLHRTYPPPFAWMEAYNLRHADYAIAGSQTAARVWRRKGYAGPLAVIPQFGVDPELFSPPAEPPADQPCHIAYVGRWVPEKGVDLLLAALDGLAGEWHATILGGGPEDAALRAQAQAHPHAEQIAFCPWIASAELPAFYRTVDILVLPSRTRTNWMEQFGRVLIEAMACGVAVVGSDSGEIPHVIADAGEVFPEDNVEALRAALTGLVNDPARRRALAERGRARMLARFTQHRVAEETVDVYREMLH